MANIDKAAIADLFRRPDAWKWLIIATKAFGLGMNIPDVSFVCILGCPSLVSDFYQWIGRAGRNGRRSYAFLYFKRVDMSSTDTSMMDICAGGEFMPGCVWDKLNAIFSPRYQRQAKSLNTLFPMGNQFDHILIYILCEQKAVPGQLLMPSELLAALF